MNSTDALSWPADMVVLIPVYNHGNTVAQVVCEAQALGATVVVVDDGCTDHSAEEARAAGATVLVHQTNQGKAAGLLTGMRWAQEHGYSRVFTIDADGQHPSDEIPTLLAASEKAPEAVIIGRRDMSVAPRANRFGRWMSNAGVWCCSGKKVGDSQSGMRIYPLPLSLQLPVSAHGYTFEVEILVRAAWAGTPIIPVDVRVIYPDDRITHFHRLRDNSLFTRVFIRLFVRRPFGQQLRAID